MFECPFEALEDDLPRRSSTVFKVPGCHERLLPWLHEIFCNFKELVDRDVVDGSRGKCLYGKVSIGRSKRDEYACGLEQHVGGAGHGLSVCVCVCVCVCACNEHCFFRKEGQ